MADASLDDELLAAVGVGRSGSSRIPPSARKRGRHGGSSDEDYEDDPSEFKRDSDDDEGDDSDNDKNGNRKGTGSKVPLKKRLDKDDDDGSGDGYGSDLSYGSDLIKDEEDRERLDRMSELDREMLLLERSERREAYLKRKASAARQKKEGGGGGGVGSSLGKQKDLQTPLSSSRMRSSTRDSQRNVNKHALNKLISARREKARESDQRRNSSNLRSSPRRKSREGSSSPSLPDEDDSSDDDRKYRNRRKDSDGGESDDDQGDLKLEDVSSITIRRSKLAKWFLEPFFEEIIQNCFVRVGVGIKDNHSVYRLCQVKNVDARDPDKQYKFENRMTHKWLNLVWGNSEARWQMARISDQPPTQNEFLQWCREVDKSNARKPTITDITEKREAIAKLSTFVYSADLVKKMLHEKKQSLARPSNVAAEKDRLLKDLAIAESKDDQIEVERIQRRLKELEAYSIQSQSKDAKALALAQMNKRNRYENFKNASELKPVSHAKQGEAGYDPFSRRWTRSQNYYDKSSKSKEKSAEELEAEKAQGAAADAGKLTDTAAPVDDETKLFSLHDFHLPISLSGVQKFANFQVAYIARKQRLETTCGVPVEGSDGRRHMLTLTVNDYKRRRGLL